jgi:aspartate carbamoyltransferase regulatory subunit
MSKKREDDCKDNGHDYVPIEEFYDDFELTDDDKDVMICQYCYETYSFEPIEQK